MRYGGASTLSAVVWGLENWYPMDSAQVLRRIVFQDPSLTPSQTRTAEENVLLDQLAEYEATHPEVVEQLRTESKGDLKVYTNLLIQSAFEGNTKNMTLVKNAMKVDIPEMGIEDFYRQFTITRDQLGAIFRLPAFREMAMFKDMSTEEMMQFATKLTVQNLEAVHKNKVSTDISRDITWKDRAMRTYRSRFPAMPDAVARDDVDKIYQEALKRTPKDEEGLMRRDEFERNLDKLFEQAIEQRQKTYGK